MKKRLLTLVTAFMLGMTLAQVPVFADENKTQEPMTNENVVQATSENKGTEVKDGTSVSEEPKVETEASQGVSEEPKVETEASQGVSEEPKVETEASQGVKDTPTATHNDITVKDGLYINVALESYGIELNYIPEFKLEIRDSKDKLLGSAVGNSSNFNKENKAYTLVFNLPEYKDGDSFRLVLDSADSSVKGLRYDLVTREGENIVATKYLLERNKYVTLPISHIHEVDPRSTEDNIIEIETLTGSKHRPFLLFLKTDSSKVGVLLKDTNNNKLKGETVIITSTKTKENFEVKSDSYGIAWIDKTKVSPQFIVEMKNTKLFINNGAEGSLVCTFPYSVIGPDAQDTTLVYEAIIGKNPYTTTEENGNVNIKVTTKSNIELSSHWSDFDIIFKGKNNTQTITLKLGDHTIPYLLDDTYELSVGNSAYSNVTLKTKTLNVVNGRGNLEIEVSPKYQMEVSKAGDKYSFSVINIDSLKDKKYEGTNATVFAVMPGESYMIKDNGTEEVMTVSITPESPLTKVILGQGVVFGGTVTTPHTGDSLPIMLSILGVVILALFFIGFKVLKHKKIINTSKNSLLSIILAISMVSSILVAFPTEKLEVKAAAGASEQPALGKGVSARDGMLVGDGTTSDGIRELPAVLRVSLVFAPGLTENATIADMDGAAKFASRDYDLYFPENADAMSMWLNSGYVGFRGEDLMLYYGNSMFTVENENFNTEGRAARTKALDVNSDNLVIKTISIGMQNKGSNRIMTSKLGDSLNAEIQSRFYGDSPQAQADRDKFIEDYFSLIRGILGDNPAVQAQIEGTKWAYENDMISVVVQVLMPMKLMNSESYDNKNFISVTDMTRMINKSQGDVPTYREKNNLANSVTHGQTTTSCSDDCALYMHPAFYGRKYSTQFINAIWPRSNVVTSASGNPYGGWGFWHWKGSGDKNIDNKPKISADMNVTVVDANGRATGTTFTTAVPGWKESDNKFLKELSHASQVNPVVEQIMGPMTIQHNGKTYNLKAQSSVKVDLYDVKDREALNKSTMKRGTSASPINVRVPIRDNPNSWRVWLGTDTLPNADKLNTYLGGYKDSRSSNSDMLDYESWLNGGSVDTTENKYKDSNTYSDAKMVIYLQAVEVKEDNDDIVHVVPEWRLSKYWGKLNTTTPASGTIKVKLKPDDPNSHKTSTFTWWGTKALKGVDPSTSAYPWVQSKATLLGRTYAALTHNKLVDTVPVSGSLLLTKTGEISKGKFANWLSVVPNVSGITSTVKGEADTTTVVTKPVTLEYGLAPYFLGYTHGIAKYKHSTDPVTGKDICECYLEYEDVTPKCTGAKYNIKTVFNLFNPMVTAASRFSGSSSGGGTNTYTSVMASSVGLKVNPEVAMAFDDKNGNTSAGFVAGGVLRDINPLSYHSAVANVTVDSDVNGPSIATDANAKKLASDLGATNTSVLYKGSPYSANFDMKGNLVVKSYVLDIGNESLKNSWNPGTSYKATAINDQFLSTFATKNSNNTWNGILDTSASVKINGKVYGEKNNTKTIVSTATTETVHKIVVRGGKVVSVDGKAPSAIGGELKTALEKMKITTSNNVFNAFASGKGANLTEQVVADRINAIRGTSDLANGKPWYYEDTTVLVVREFTTEFGITEQTVLTDKLPMDIQGIETPIDKNFFFKNYSANGKSYKGGYTGYSTMRATIGSLVINYDSSTGSYGSKEAKFIVGNASILDTTR